MDDEAKFNIYSKTSKMAHKCCFEREIVFFSNKYGFSHFSSNDQLLLIQCLGFVTFQTTVEKQKCNV